MISNYFQTTTTWTGYCAGERRGAQVRRRVAFQRFVMYTAKRSNVPVCGEGHRCAAAWGMVVVVDSHLRQQDGRGAGCSRMHAV